MANKVEDKAFLVFVDRHIEELDERINALKNRMTAMVLERYETKNQEVLLTTMLEVRADLEKFRAEIIEDFKENHGDTYPY